MFRSLMPFGSRALSAERDDPFSSLQREMNRLFDDMLRGVPRGAGTIEPAGLARWSPSLDVKESANEVVVTADLPGLDQKDVEVTLKDDLLTIKGERKAEKSEKGENWQVMERSYGSFQRSIALPFTADASAVQASFDKGVLTIHLPKPPEIKTAERKIPIGQAGGPGHAA